ncbi:HAD family hydrolase [Aquibacillus kalidii]|uniref:HAD family hydrolase n=1 Tax=Aquibacillus kalidii TaxID=2762597 RepID=UPI001644B454|nr:HAD family hydrolase [Aquibacillus kalidii]
MNTIIFDVDDTLYDQAKSFHITFIKMFGDILNNVEIDKLYKASRKHSEVLFDQSEKGEITQLEWQTGRIIAACQDFGIPVDFDKALEFHKTYVIEQQNITLFSEVEGLLDKLHTKGKQLAILTNGEEKHQAMKIKQLNLSKWFPEENIFISGTYGHAKPKREIFDIVEQRLELDPTETVYIGDNYEKDIVGAKQAGWKAIWMNHRKRKLPVESPIKPDKEVHSPEELVELFS